jgi:2-polyprenyl-3-methyl-5-hydroxy-6-metoxy-1,4-benzoquinol methylase
METKCRFLAKHAYVLWLSCTLSLAAAQPGRPEQRFGPFDRLRAGSELTAEGEAKEILDTVGIKGGLIVHIGCGDGKLTAALRAGESYLVQGLDTDAQAVQGAREHIRKVGVYGPVSVEGFDGMAAAYGRLYVSMMDGSLLCMAQE